MDQRAGIKEGMIVRSVDGHKLGKVYAVGGTEFHIEKGIFFPKDYSVRFSEVSAIRDGEIILAHGRDSLTKFSLDDVPRSDPLDSGRVAAVRPDAASVATWNGLPLDRPATPSELSGLTSDDLGYREVGTHNTEGASASILETEEDRVRARPLPSSDLGLMPPPLPAARPVMRASSGGSYEDDYSAAVLENDYRSALLENDYRSALLEDELYETRRSSTRGDGDRDDSRRLNFSGDSDPFTKRGY